MSTLRVTEIQSNSTSFNTPVRFENAGGTENGKLCRTWVNFNGQGTVAIRGNFNVNSISDRGTGRFTCNFANALGNSTYAAVGETNSDSFSVVVGTSICKSNVSPGDAAPTSSAYQFSCTYSFSGGQSRFDPTYGFLAFFE